MPVPAERALVLCRAEDHGRDRPRDARPASRCSTRPCAACAAAGRCPTSGCTLFATEVCTGLRVGGLLSLRWRDVNLAQGRLTVIDSKTEAGRGREVDLWPELREELSVYKTQARHAQPGD
jgi:hypothetical protein